MLKKKKSSNKGWVLTQISQFDSDFDIDLLDKSATVHFS